MTFLNAPIDPTVLATELTFSLNTRASNSITLARRLVLCSTQEARAVLPYLKACEYRVLPLSLVRDREESTLVIAASVLTQEQIVSLEFLVACPIKIVEVKLADFELVIFQAYKGGGASLSTLEAELQSDLKQHARVVEVEDDQHQSSLAAKFFYNLLEYAVAVGASDIHILPKFEGSQVQLRVNGEVAQARQGALSPKLHSEIVNRIKILAQLDISKKNIPLDGSITMQLGAVDVNFRVSTLPSIHGEIVAIRVLGNLSALTLEQLGLAQEIQGMIVRFTRQSEGAIILSGPTGSGKTQTLYAIAEHLSKLSQHVVSVEDPVECRVRGISQVSINNAAGLTFAAALKAVLRQDPDVIMLGEMRDAESATIAMQAAQTGHLLLSSLHSGNCFEALMRLRDLNIDLLTISQSVSLIISQRLVRTLCTECRVYDLESSRNKNYDLYRPVGCSACDYSGYAARIPVSEALLLDATLATQIRQGALSSNQLSSYITRSNYYSRQQDLQKLVQQGKISFNQFKQI